MCNALASPKFISFSMNLVNNDSRCNCYWIIMDVKGTALWIDFPLWRSKYMLFIVAHRFYNKTHSSDRCWKFCNRGLCSNLFTFLLFELSNLIERYMDSGRTLIARQATSDSKESRNSFSLQWFFMSCSNSKLSSTINPGTFFTTVLNDSDSCVL
jgi:hypothetical protein